jgi:hypothetical protein
VRQGERECERTLHHSGRRPPEVAVLACKSRAARFLSGSTRSNAELRRRVQWRGVLSNPIGKSLAGHVSGSQREHDRFLFIDRGVELEAIEHQKNFHGGVADALVPINEGVTLDERKSKSGGLLAERRVELSAIEGGHGLRECGLNAAEVPDASRAAG